MYIGSGSSGGLDQRRQDCTQIVNACADIMKLIDHYYLTILENTIAGFEITLFKSHCIFMLFKLINKLLKLIPGFVLTHNTHINAANISDSVDI